MRDTTDGFLIYRSITPAENGEALFNGHTFNDALADEALGVLYGQETHTDGVLAEGRKREAELRRFATEEFIGNLDENSSAIAGFGIASTGSAVSQIDENLDPFCDDFVGRFRVDIDNKAETAVVALVCRTIKTLLYG